MDIKTRYTKPQLLLAEWIRELGFSSTLEKEFGPYQVDIYLSEPHLAIEVDSAYHISKKRDQKRDVYLKEMFNLPTFRIDCKEIIPKKKQCILEKLLTVIQTNAINETSNESN